MKIFTSDLHFGHKNILKYTNRHTEFNSIEEHDIGLIEIWNCNVGPDDDVYHLGDFAFISDYNKLRAIVQKLNGQKYFIAGNHDNIQHMQRLVDEGWINSISHYKEIKIGDYKAVLCHYPMSSWNRQHHGSFMLHGHTHGGLNPEFNKGRILDVGLDNYYKQFGNHDFYYDIDIIDQLGNKPIYTNDEHEPRKGE